MATVAQRVLPRELIVAAPRCFGSVFVALAIWFSASLLWNAWDRRDDAFTFFLSTATFLLLASTLKIPGNFSSRYGAMTFPLLIPLLAASRDPDQGLAPCRSLLGNLLGAGSLLSYLHRSAIVPH